MARLASEPMPNSPMVKAIAPKAPMGASFISMCTSLKITSLKDASTSNTRSLCGRVALMATPERMATSSTCRIDPLVTALNSVVGMMPSRKPDRLWCSAVSA